MSSTTPPRRRAILASPAVIALAQADATTLDLAAVLGVSRRCASFYLGGQLRTPPRLPAALSDLIGDEAAQRVLAAIPQRRPDGATVAP